ncbi:MAG: heavy metal-associated domain-containing protein [Bacteroidia bacterium]
MKTIIKSLIVFVIAFSLVETHCNASPYCKASLPYVAKDTLVVMASIICETCKKTIEEGLRFEKGIKLATVNVEAKTVTVIYNTDKTNPGEIRKAISKLGYDADDVPADKKSYDKLEKCCKKDGHH